MTTATLLLGFKSFANPKIEQAIIDSRPEQLKQLLDQTTIDQQEMKNYLQIATEVYRMRSSSWGENPRPGEPYLIASAFPFVGASALSMPLIFEFIDPSLKSRDRSFRYKLITAGLYFTSFALMYLGYKENQKPGWRSKRDERLAALKLMQILSNFIEKNNEQ